MYNYKDNNFCYSVIKRTWLFLVLHLIKKQLNFHESSFHLFYELQLKYKSYSTINLLISLVVIINIFCGHIIKVLFIRLLLIFTPLQRRRLIKADLIRNGKKDKREQIERTHMKIFIRLFYIKTHRHFINLFISINNAPFIIYPLIVVHLSALKSKIISFCHNAVSATILFNASNLDF